MIIGEECYDSVYDQAWKFLGELVAPEPTPPAESLIFLWCILN
jgi:hypothetical protein